MPLDPDQEEFLGRVKAAAPVTAEQDIPPAVMVAQAIVESGWGRSRLARAGKNLFGIKAGPSWAGAVYSGTTREWDGTTYVTYPGTNRVYESHAAAMADGCSPASLFRAYPSLDESIEDHARFFHENPRYHHCIEQYRKDHDAEAFAVCIHGAGYATGPAYAQTLISVIRQYAAELLAPTPPSESTGAPKVIIDGRDVDAADARMIEGRVFIYVRVLERLGFGIVWNPAGPSVEVTRSKPSPRSGGARRPRR